MFRKLFVFVLFSMFMSAAAFSQDLPSEPKAPRAVFSFAFGGGFLGVQATDISNENMELYALNQVRGVAVEKVLADSPAAKSGILDKDVIILFNDVAVTSVRQLTRLISEVAPDHSVSITVLRNGSEREFNVTLSKRELPQDFTGDFNFEKIPVLPAIPDLKEFPKGQIPNVNIFPAPRPGEPDGFIWSTGSKRKIGVSVSSLSKQLGDYFGVAEGKGLLVNNVRENSPAAKAGLRAGDVIIEVNGIGVENGFNLTKAINEKQEGDVILTVLRDKVRQTILVTPESDGEGAVRFNRQTLDKYFELEKNANRMNMRVANPDFVPFTVQTAGTSRIL